MPKRKAVAEVLPEPEQATHAQADGKARSKTTPRSQRKRPLRSLTLSPEAWARLDEIAHRWSATRSAAVERLIQEATMPEGIR